MSGWIWFLLWEKSMLTYASSNNGNTSPMSPTFLEVCSLRCTWSALYVSGWKSIDDDVHGRCLPSWRHHFWTLCCHPSGPAFVWCDIPGDAFSRPFHGSHCVAASFVLLVLSRFIFTQWWHKMPPQLARARSQSSCSWCSLGLHFSNCCPFRRSM